MSADRKMRRRRPATGVQARNGPFQPDEELNENMLVNSPSTKSIASLNLRSITSLNNKQKFYSSA
jgi:hypothetical protein